MKEVEYTDFEEGAAAIDLQPLIIPPLAWDMFKEHGLLSQDANGRWYLYRRGWVVRGEYAK